MVGPSQCPTKIDTQKYTFLTVLLFFPTTQTENECFEICQFEGVLSNATENDTSRELCGQLKSPTPKSILKFKYCLQLCI